MYTYKNPTSHAAHLSKAPIFSTSTYMRFAYYVTSMEPTEIQSPPPISPPPPWSQKSFFTVPQSIPNPDSWSSFTISTSLWSRKSHNFCYYLRAFNCTLCWSIYTISDIRSPKSLNSMIFELLISFKKQSIFRSLNFILTAINHLQ